MAKRSKFYSSDHITKKRIKRPGRHSKSPNKKFSKKKYRGQGKKR